MLALSGGLRERGYSIEILELTGVVPGQASFADEFREQGIARNLPKTCYRRMRSGLSAFQYA
jgi:hypothetical protein